MISSTGNAAGCTAVEKTSGAAMPIPQITIPATAVRPPPRKTSTASRMRAAVAGE